MVSVLLVLISLAVILYRCYKYTFERPSNFPPGPPKMPIFGSYLFILPLNYKHMHRATEAMAKWYKTSILGYHFGSTPTLSIHDLDTTKEVLNNPDIDGRPIFPMVRARDPLFNVWGIFNRDDLFWRNQRRFTLRHLRDFGFGRRFDELEMHIDEELRSLVDLIRNGAKYDYEKKLITADGLVSVPHMFSGHPVNLFLKCLINERLNRADLQAVFQVSEAVFRFQRNGCMFGRIFSLFESLKYIIPNWSGYNAIRNNALEIHSYINTIVQEQYNTFEPTHERHFLDLYFAKVRDEKADFTLEQLTHTIMDFIIPSASIISSTITFLLQRLILNPDYMEKCQRQIDEVIGNGRLATLDDRINLSYVEAALRESMRLETVVPNNVPHRALRATTVAGYDLPKGGLVVTVLQTANTDEKHFKDPETFQPERFLSANGKINLKLDKSIPFGIGKRLCPGETFSRNILFLFVSTILQNFNVSVPDGHSLNHPSLEHQTTGIIRTPSSSYLKFTSR